MSSNDLPKGEVGLGNTQHVDGGLVQLDEGAVVDLPQSQQLHDLTGTRVDAVDTGKGKTTHKDGMPNTVRGSIIHNFEFS